MSSYAVNTTTTAGSADQTANPNSTLGQAQFLQLLVTQMTQQDPLNPESDTDFAAQLAQFSSLQETTSMAGNMSELQADALIGQTVDVASASNNADQTTGVVQGVDISSGSPEVLVNGQLYSLSQILSITPTPSATTAATPTSTTANLNVKP